MDRHSTGNRDQNEKEITELLKKRNVRYEQLTPGQGADLLVMLQPMEFWEVKNPNQRNQKLTDAEAELQTYCQRTKIPYIIITALEEALLRINMFFWNGDRL